MVLKTSLLCNKIQPYEVNHCKDIVSPIEVLIESNYVKANSLSHIISENSPVRSKRSLEFGGEILKFFFGTLDADDARKYDAAINTCQNSEKELFKLMKDNIHIVKSSINSFNSTIYRLNVNENKLNSQINKLNDILEQTTRNNAELVYLTRLNSLVNILESSLLALSNLLDTILNAILFAKVNVLHPSILSPTYLYNELSKNSHLMIKRLDFPVSLSIENIHTIIDVSKLTSYYYNRKIVFVMEIPLISSIKYMSYKVIPLPTPHNVNQPTTFALIQPTKPYLALTEDNLNYAMLDNLNECKIISSDYSICPAVSTFSCLSNPSCETRLITEVSLSLPKECNSKLIYGDVDIWQKLTNNRWIFVQSKNNKLTVKCNDILSDSIISGTGILKLSEDCIGYSKTTQLIPSTVYTFRFANQLRSDFIITEDDCCNKQVINKSIHLLTPISMSNIDLDSLKHASHQLNDLENEINKAENESHIVKYGNYYSGLTYCIITCIILYFCFKVYKYFCCNPNSNCCIQIYNQCNTRKTVRHNAKLRNSIELSDMTSDEDDKPVKSLSIADSQFNISNRNLAHN